MAGTYCEWLEARGYQAGGYWHCDSDSTIEQKSCRCYAAPDFYIGERFTDDAARRWCRWNYAVSEDGERAVGLDDRCRCVEARPGEDA